MLRLKTMSSQRLSTLVLGSMALLLVLCIIVFPEQAFQSSLQGLSIWWKLVFPALLPFLIMTEIARGLGILHGLGALLEPLLRLLFRLPGTGGWAIALGLTAGTPSGAIAACGLRRDKLITRDEAERLLTLSHLLSPVFMITVVGAGFMNNVKAGLGLAILHYGSAVLLAIIQRFTSVRIIAEREVVINRRAEAREQPATGLIGKSIAALQKAQAADGRTFGKLLGDSVGHSVQHLMAVGGMIMIFSVIIHAVSLSGAASHVSALFSGLEPVLGFALEPLLNSVLPGFFEAHLGAYALGQNPSSTGSWQYALMSALFAWGGLSTHAQVKSFTLGTDIRYKAFLRARLMHAAIAFVSTGMLWQPLSSWLTQRETPAFLQTSPEAANAGSFNEMNLWAAFSPMMLWFGCILLVMLALSVFLSVAFRNAQAGDNRFIDKL